MPSHAARTIVLTAIALTTLAGCSSQDEASESNFKTVLQNYYDSQDEPASCIAGRYIDALPYQYPDPNEFMSDAGPELDKRLAVLVDSGLLQEPSSDRTYQATETGSAAFQPERGGFCFGRLQVEEVSNFTTPSERGGFTISQVNYTVSVADRPEWSKNAELLGTFGLAESGLSTSGFMSRNENPESKKMILVKTNNGWVTQEEMD